MLVSDEILALYDRHGGVHFFNLVTETAGTFRVSGLNYRVKFRLNGSTNPFSQDVLPFSEVVL